MRRVPQVAAKCSSAAQQLQQLSSSERGVAQVLHCLRCAQCAQRATLRRMSGEGTCFNSSLTPSPGELRPQQMDQSSHGAALRQGPQAHDIYVADVHLR